PGMWAGIASITKVWTPSRIGLSQSQLAALGREGERNHDASLLAFVAMFSKPAEALRYADEAVAADPSLAWIYFEIRHRWPQAAENSEAEFVDRMRKLEAAEPDNAVSYLAEAETYFASAEPHLSPARLGEAAQEMEKNPAWLAAMQKALSAPRYDSYASRRFDLVLSVMRERRMERPIDLMYAEAATPIPDLYNLRVFLISSVLKRAEASAASGDVRGAQKQYRDVILFSQRMRRAGSSSTIENLMALEFSRKAFESESKTLSGTDSNGDAANASVAHEEIETELAAFRAAVRREWAEGATAAPSAFIIHICTVIAVLCGVVCLTAFVAFGCGLGDHPVFGRAVCRAARISPYFVLPSLALFYVNYLPYHKAFWTVSSKDLGGVSWQLGALLAQPVYFVSTNLSHTAVLFWTSIILVGAIAATLIVARMAVRNWSEQAQA
ncbi:MAG TPA: hypothetical protein VFO34_05530, partial [Candidatus Acidoferrales bacterium]|nr:hypothetical protein [Candidatus Acidoferrales bacterium]